MKPAFEHDWDLSPTAAIALQRELARLVVERPLRSEPETIAGIDVSVRGRRVRTAVVVLAFPDLSLVEERFWEGEAAFPYVPGLLSFREIPAILPALNRLESRPDVFMLDGQGKAHPRRFGLASHLGVLMGTPSFGVAKSRLIGDYADPAPLKGAVSPLTSGNEQIGAVVRTRTNVRPVYVSVGHLLTLEDAVRLTLRTSIKFRIPVPTREAHFASKRTVSRGVGPQ